MICWMSAGITLREEVPSGIANAITLRISREIKAFASFIRPREANNRIRNRVLMSPWVNPILVHELRVVAHESPVLGVTNWTPRGARSYVPRWSGWRPRPSHGCHLLLISSCGGGSLICRALASRHVVDEVVNDLLQLGCHLRSEV